MTVVPASPQELTWHTFDGTELFYRAWIPEGGFTRALVLFHRGHEHSGRMAGLVEALRTEGTAYFAWDSRGHGKSPGERGCADHLMDVVRDADTFVKHISANHGVPIENISVLAHSVAAVVAGLWLHDFAPRIRSIILATPALRVKLYVPFALPALRLQLWWTRKRGGNTPFVKSYVAGKLLTHDPEEAKRYDEDPLVSKQIAVNVLLDLHDSSTRLLADAGAIKTPLLLLAARTDWVVRNKPARKFFSRISSPVKRVAVYRGMYHSIFHETDRALPIEACRRFLAETENIPVERGELLEADRAGYSAEEFEWLRAGLPMICFKRFGYRAVRWLMQTAGRLSDGIRIGWETGFNSGTSLDHVYRNVASGTGPLGRMIDRQYLDAPGWKGIRQRKLNIETLLDRAIDVSVSRNGGSPVRILDIAGGPARYLLDTAKRRSTDRLEITVRDASEADLEQGRALAASLRVASVRFELGDAFDEEALARTNPNPDIVIVSGLYELFSENEAVLRSLRGISRAVKPGGFLIYTNQPWHPQLEFIAEVLLNRDGSPWVMRCRTQAEMDELVRSVGFEKRAMRIDNAGIFTVSLAERK